MMNTTSYCWYRDSAAALLLRELGQDGEVEDYVGEAEYEGCSYRRIKIDRSNVQSVESVNERDDEGTDTLINDSDYTVRYKNGNAYIEGEFNKEFDQHMVIVAYKRGFVIGGKDTALLKQVMLDTINSMYVSPGRLTENTLRRSPAFNAAMSILKDNRSRIKWSS